MKMILIDTEKNSSKVINTDGGLENYYKLLNCDLIDITERKIGGQYFDIICDDEGLFKEGNRVSAVSEDGRPQLVGSLLICNHDGEGGGVWTLGERRREAIKTTRNRHKSGRREISCHCFR